jgi:hypothetical protein
MQGRVTTSAGGGAAYAAGLEAEVNATLEFGGPFFCTQPSERLQVAFDTRVPRACCAGMPMRLLPLSDLRRPVTVSGQAASVLKMTILAMPAMTIEQRGLCMDRRRLSARSTTALAADVQTLSLRHRHTDRRRRPRPQQLHSRLTSDERPATASRSQSMPCSAARPETEADHVHRRSGRSVNGYRLQVDETASTMSGMCISKGSLWFGSNGTPQSQISCTIICVCLWTKCKQRGFCLCTFCVG